MNRGVAMLMALATLVLVMAGLTAGLVALRGAHQSAWACEVDGHMLAGLRQGELLAGAWLQADAARTVLPPDGGGILLVDDRFLLPSGSGRLRIVAYDGLAGIPAFLAQRGSALRTALPTALTSLVVPPIDPAKADASAYLLDVLELPDEAARFPRAPAGSGRIFSAAGAGHPADTADTAPTTTGPSLAEAIAFRSDGRLNINTAPAPLVRTAYAVLGLGGVEEVLERRRHLQASPAPADAPAGANRLRLVAQSDRWQMLITVSWQDIHRSWWVDFTSSPQGSSMLQRHAIRD